MKTAVYPLRRVAFASALAASMAAALVVFFFDPNLFSFYPRCLFHRMTGLNCPGCGSLRAMHELLHGHWGAALHFNAFVILSLPLFAWASVRFASREMTGRPAIIVRPAWLWTYFGAWMVFGILRVLPLPLFASLSP